MAKKPEAPVESTQVDKAAATNLTTLQSTMLADATGGASGFEYADQNAFAIPFLQILQSGSPQCKRSEGAYIPGAREGMFYNTVTQELFEGEDITDEKTGEVKKGGIVLIPAHYSQRFIEWKPREGAGGGGFVGEYMPTDPIVLTTTKDEKNRDRLPNGNILVDTRNHYALHVKPDGQYEPVVISMTSTQLKKSRNWMSKMSGLKIKAGAKFVSAPMASHTYLARTTPESNDQGTWMGWAITSHAAVTDADQYKAAQKFREMVIKGAARMQQPAAEGQSAEPDSSTTY